MLLTNSLSDRDYDLLYDAYTGSGGFLDGSYLFQHKREDVMDFAIRKQQARYSNFTRVIVNSLVNPIFKKTIIRDYDGNDMLDAFVEDVDGLGTSLNTFMRKAAKWARLYSKVFIVMDNFTEEQMAANQQDAIERRQFPYLYVVRPNQVTDYICDKYGCFSSFSYKVRSKMSKTDLKENTEYEEWTWTADTWEMKGEKHIAQTGENPLGLVPVITLSAVDDEEDNPLPVPDMLHIARANRDLYNRDSEKREILRNQCFPVLVYPMTPAAASRAKQLDANGQELGLDIGTNNMLNVDAQSGHMPAFIAPPMEPVTVLQTEISNIIDDMFRQANLTSVLAIQTKQSGVAKQWDFEETTNVLADAAENCESTELRIFSMFQQWTNTEISDLKIKYPRSFNITDIEDELTKAQQMKDLMVGGPVVQREVDRKAAQIYFSDIDDARYDEVMDEIDNMPDDARMTQSEESSTEV